MYRRPVDADYTIEETGDAPVMVYDLPQTEDAKRFENRWRFFANAQHDHLDQSWEGQPRKPGLDYMRERYYPRGFVPLNAGSPLTRKPDMPTPTAAIIVNRNTGLMLGSPTVIKVAADDDTQELLRAVAKSSDLQVQFSVGRNMAGGGGTACEVPLLIGGKVHLEVHKPSEFKVLRWSTSESWQPSRIIRQILVTLPVRDRQGNRGFREFWQTTEWDEKFRTDYKPVPKEWRPEDPIEKVGPPMRVPHGASRCPVTWYRNTPSECMWGITDFDGLEPRCDQIDRLGSHLYSAIGKNCDPTVVQSDDAGTRRRHRFARLGRGQLLETSEKGRASLLETSGKSLEVTLDAWQKLEDETFKLADVVHINADTAGAFKSGEALRLLWRAPEVRVGWLWPQRATTMRRSLENIYDMAKAFGVSSYEMPKKGTIILPSREMKEARKDKEEAEPGPPELPAKPKLVPHKVGKFGYIELERGPYFAKTPTEINQEVQAIQAAAGGAPVLSEETAVEEAAGVMGIDPAEELRRIHEEKERSAALQAEQFKVANSELDEDAEEEGGEDQPPKPAAVDDEDEDEDAEE